MSKILKIILIIIILLILLTLLLSFVYKKFKGGSYRIGYDLHDTSISSTPIHEPRINYLNEIVAEIFDDKHNKFLTYMCDYISNEEIDDKINTSKYLIIGDVHGSVLQLFMPLKQARILNTISFNPETKTFNFTLCDDITNYKTVIYCGDFVGRAKHSATIGMLLTFLNICERVNLNEDKIIWVYGNHDIGFIKKFVFNNDEIMTDVYSSEKTDIYGNYDTYKDNVNKKIYNTAELNKIKQSENNFKNLQSQLKIKLINHLKNNKYPCIYYSEKDNILVSHTLIPNKHYISHYQLVYKNKSDINVNINTIDCVKQIYGLNFMYKIFNPMISDFEKLNLIKYNYMIYDEYNKINETKINFDEQNFNQYLKLYSEIISKYTIADKFDNIDYELNVIRELFNSTNLYTQHLSIGDLLTFSKIYIDDINLTTDGELSEEYNDLFKEDIKIENPDLYVSFNDEDNDIKEQLNLKSGLNNFKRYVNNFDILTYIDKILPIYNKVDNYFDSNYETFTQLNENTNISDINELLKDADELSLRHSHNYSFSDDLEFFGGRANLNNKTRLNGGNNINDIDIHSLNITEFDKSFTNININDITNINNKILKIIFENNIKYVKMLINNSFNILKHTYNNLYNNINNIKFYEKIVPQNYYVINIINNLYVNILNIKESLKQSSCILNTLLVNKIIFYDKMTHAIINKEYEKIIVLTDLTKFISYALTILRSNCANMYVDCKDCDKCINVRQLKKHNDIFNHNDIITYRNYITNTINNINNKLMNFNLDSISQSKLLFGIDIDNELTIKFKKFNVLLNPDYKMILKIKKLFNDISTENKIYNLGLNEDLQEINVFDKIDKSSQIKFINDLAKNFVFSSFNFSNIIEEELYWLRPYDGDTNDIKLGNNQYYKIENSKYFVGHTVMRILKQVIKQLDINTLKQLTEHDKNDNVNENHKKYLNSLELIKFNKKLNLSDDSTTKINCISYKHNECVAKYIYKLLHTDIIKNINIPKLTKEYYNSNINKIIKEIENKKMIEQIEKNKKIKEINELKINDNDLYFLDIYACEGIEHNLMSDEKSIEHFSTKTNVSAINNICNNQLFNAFNKVIYTPSDDTLFNKYLESYKHKLDVVKRINTDEIGFYKSGFAIVDNEGNVKSSKLYMF